MRTRPRAENGLARAEEIRELLGMSKGEFSLALGFKTLGGYHAATSRNEIAMTHVLAAEGLLATRGYKNGETKSFILEIDGNGNTTVRPLPKMSEMTFNGKTFKLMEI